MGIEEIQVAIGVISGAVSFGYKAADFIMDALGIEFKEQEHELEEQELDYEEMARLEEIEVLQNELQTLTTPDPSQLTESERRDVERFAKQAATQLKESKEAYEQEYGKEPQTKWDIEHPAESQEAITQRMFALQTGYDIADRQLRNMDKEYQESMGKESDARDIESHIADISDLDARIEAQRNSSHGDPDKLEQLEKSRLEAVSALKREHEISPEEAAGKIQQLRNEARPILNEREELKKIRSEIESEQKAILRKVEHRPDKEQILERIGKTESSRIPQPDHVK
ncbi:MAG: hypothetical protein FWD25_01060 [Clostridia bacterium]|nr:hypothetical protein [Clostridia bacterium]